MLSFFYFLSLFSEYVQYCCIHELLSIPYTIYRTSMALSWPALETSGVVKLIKLT